MKIDELMVGDFIYVHEPECKWHRIDSIDELDGQVGADGEVYDECDIRPIPLTEEILVKNGFELGEKIGEVGVHIYRHTVYKMDNFSLEVYSDNTFHFASIKLHYVHQLQHLLRLCNVQKEIEL